MKKGGCQNNRPTSAVGFHEKPNAVPRFSPILRYRSSASRWPFFSFPCFQGFRTWLSHKTSRFDSGTWDYSVWMSLDRTGRSTSPLSVEQRWLVAGGRHRQYRLGVVPSRLGSSATAGKRKPVNVDAVGPTHFGWVSTDHPNDVGVFFLQRALW